MLPATLFSSGTLVLGPMVLSTILGVLTWKGIGIWILILGALSGGEDAERPSYREPASEEGECRGSDRDPAPEKAPGLLSAKVHDLKTPLSGIRELSRLLLQNESLSPPLQRKLELIFASSEEAMGLVDGLLSVVTEVEETEPELQVEAFDLRALAKEVVESHRLHAEYKQQTIHCELPDEECTVRGDRARLRQAAGNLVSNALKYSPPEETVKAGVHRTDDALRFSVADHGPGLSETDRTRLFRPFQQSSSRSGEPSDSSGLGLYVTRRIMTLHGGDVDVATTEGEGSTFSLVFPLPMSSESS